MTQPAPQPTPQPTPPPASQPPTPLTKTPTVQPTPSVKEGAEEQRKQQYFQLRERLLSDIEKVKKGEKTKEKFKEDWGDEYDEVLTEIQQKLEAIPEGRIDFLEIDPKKPAVDQIGEVLSRDKVFRGTADNVVLRSLITNYIGSAVNVGSESFRDVVCSFEKNGFLYKAQLNVLFGQATVELFISVDKERKLKLESVNIRGEGTAAKKAQEKQVELSTPDYNLTEALITGLNKQLKKYKTTITDAWFEIKDGKLLIEMESKTV
jgi:hypothetical protein